MSAAPDPHQGGMTRRELVIGGGVAALAIVAGGALLERETITREVHRLEARYQHAPIPPLSGSRIVNGSFDSKILGKAVGYSMAWPPGSAPGDRLPVAFCLPGRGETAGNVTGADLYLAGFLGEAVHAGARPFALAAVDGGETYWHRRASGEDRMAMLVDEFIPLCHRRFALGGDAGRAVMGWSMGGYGALLAAETYPGTFSSAVATSPAVWPTYADMMNGPRDAFDSAADFAAHDVMGHASRLAGTPLFVACGTGDPFYPFVRQLAPKLPPEARVVFATGGHTAAFWRLQAPAELRFVAGQFG